MIDTFVEEGDTGSALMIHWIFARARIVRSGTPSIPTALLRDSLFMAVSVSLISRLNGSYSWMVVSKLRIV